MSLELAARHLAAQGRDGDSVLVHMTPNEVKGLQALAMAHGGSLTINPQTGLPEAGFLKKLLPAVAGFALTGGLGFTALQAGLGVGALSAAREGSLKKGIFAGLSAYGGASLASGITEAGSAKLAADEAAASTAAKRAAVDKAATEAAAKQAVAKQAATSSVPTYLNPATKPGLIPTAPPVGIASSAPAYTPASVAPVTGSAIPAGVQQSAAQGYAAGVTPSAFSAGASQVAAAPLEFLKTQKTPLIAAGIGTAGLAGLEEEERAERLKRRMLAEAGGKTWTDEELEPYRRRHLYERDYTGGIPTSPDAPFTSELTYFTPRPRPVQGLAAMAEGGTTKVSRDTRTPPALVQQRQQDQQEQQSIAEQIRKYQTPAPYPVGADFAPQMSGASRQAYEYLMGRGPSLPAVTAPSPYRITPPTEQAAAPAAAPIKYTQNIPTGTGYANADYLKQALTTGTVVGIPTEHMENVKRELDLLAAQGRLPGFIADPTRRGGGYENVRRRTAKGGEIKLQDGGSVGLEHGGFVVPADVVSALGNGSSSAGLEVLANRIGAKPIRGPGDGMSDSIRTSIEGKRPAAIARDEAYVPPDRVAKAGGADKLYGMMDRVRKKAHGKTTQQRKVNPRKLVP